MVEYMIRGRQNMIDKSGEFDNFSSLFEQYKKPYTFFAYSYVRDMNEAEDIYMDVMMRLWENRKELTGDTHFPSYILTAIKNRALNYLRQQNTVTDANQNLTELQQLEMDLQISSLEACDPTELFTDEIQQIVQTTLDDMPENTRLIFFRSRYENKTNREISNELDINIKTVEYHISKALKALRKNLKDYLPFLF